MSAKQKFTYNFTVECHTKEESIQIMESFQKLAAVAEVKDLVTIANKVKANPKLIKTALKYL